ncbi:MAG: hypothetical protein GX383_00850 [Clostridium sp.]|jgi:hypothetical protein|nr:hypothetical protein [Clostridium sp.]
MYEFHGWATIRKTPANVDEEGLYEIADEIRSHIAKLNWGNNILNLHAVNGIYHILLAGCSNRKPINEDNPVEFFEYIARLTPGSYGILYVMDDEDTDGFDNEFRVYVLSRGRVLEKKDVYLSPFIPIVEDEE